MRKEVHRWYSPRIGKEMPIAVYGHYGFPLLMIPTAMADFEEYERFHLLTVMKPYIEAGKVKVFSIDSVNAHTWMNTKIPVSERARKHEFFDRYVTQEVVPFIWAHQGGNKRGIVTTGASMGAFHAVNLLLRHPDLFDGTIGMSGAYDLEAWTGGYMDTNVYFNSPLAYMPNLNGGPHLDLLRQKRDIHILTGTGAYEAPGQSRRLAEILWSKGIHCNLDMWGPDMRHDWPTWRAMMPLYLANAF